MLRNASSINGYAIAASDGCIGTVSDFLFDDAGWSVRWLVVETGTWLSHRKVLLPPAVLGRLYPEGEEFTVQLTMKQVKDSPDIDSDRPVSRQFETNLYNYYGWSPYWSGGFYMGGIDALDSAAMASVSALNEQREENDDPHLRSIHAVTGYHIHADDGEVGHVEDFLIDDSDWNIHYLLVDTQNWWPGKKVLISPRSVADIDWADRRVNLNVPRLRVKNSPAYDASITIDQTYEKDFHKYYYSEVRPSDHL